MGRSPDRQPLIDRAGARRGRGSRSWSGAWRQPCSRTPLSARWRCCRWSPAIRTMATPPRWRVARRRLPRREGSASSRCDGAGAGILRLLPRNSFVWVMLGGRLFS